MTQRSERSVQLDVTILGREYKVACKESERAELAEAVTLLDGRMREIRDTGKVIGLDRIAVMAALNMANELIVNRSKGAVLEGDVKVRVQAMRERVEGALNTTRQLEL